MYAWPFSIPAPYRFVKRLIVAAAEMRFTSTSSLAACLLATNVTAAPAATSTSISYPSTTYPTTPAYPYCTSYATPFASVDDVHPRLFNYNGTGAKFFAGTNSWWASNILSDKNLEKAFSEIKNTQLQVTRVWGFSSVNTDPGPDTVFFQLLNSTGSYINYAANGIPRLDAVVSYAEKNGIKVVLNFVSHNLRIYASLVQLTHFAGKQLVGTRRNSIL